MSAPADSAMSRFVRAHLPTPTERAVYSALAGSLKLWTARSVAGAAGVSDHEADQALRRFAAAGIIERVETPGQPRRYRWRTEMGYLSDGGPSPRDRVDPVCGMPVPAESAHTALDGDTEVAFCSLPCLVRWRFEHRVSRLVPP